MAPHAILRKTIYMTYEKGYDQDIQKQTAKRKGNGNENL